MLNVPTSETDYIVFAHALDNVLECFKRHQIVLSRSFHFIHNPKREKVNLYV